MSAKAETRRRAFLKWLPRIALSLWGVGFVGVMLSYLRSPTTPRFSATNVVGAGRADTLVTGTARFIRHGSEPLYVVRLADGEIIALSALCTHYRCVLEWKAQEKVLACPCHNGLFNATGQVISGLPKKDLAIYRTQVRLGEILVHLPRST